MNPALRIPIVLTTFALTAAAPAQPAARTFPLVADGGAAAGEVTIMQAPRGILLRVLASGLTPGWHGMHIHSVATCADAGFKASGGHIHDALVTAPVHGLLNAAESDSGDLPNVFADSGGKVNADVFASGLTLGPADGRLNILDTDGSALVIHAAADDYLSQPIGGAGARVACAAIK